MRGMQGRGVRYAIALTSPIMEEIAAIAFALLLLWGRDLINQHVFTPGTYVAFPFAVFRLYDPIRRVAILLNNQGANLLDSLEYEEAGAVFERTIAIEERVLSADDPKLAEARHNLGTVRYYQRRLPEARRFQIEPAGGEALGTGDVTLLGRDIVHSVVNPLARLSAAIHVYDGPFLTVERSMWDAETLSERPYDVNAVAKGMSVQLQPHSGSPGR